MLRRKDSGVERLTINSDSSNYIGLLDAARKIVLIPSSKKI